MTKLQTNFSLQSFQDDNIDSKKQFIYQLQTLFTNVSNAVNSTIDDLSYWSTERITGFSWVNNKPIYTKTLTGTVSGSTNTVAHGITNLFMFTEMRGILSTGTPISGTANTNVPIPNASTTSTLNIGVSADTTNITVSLDGATWSGATFYVNLQYIKV